MRSVSLLGLLFLGALLTGCASTPSHFRGVRPGMSPAQVQSEMGVPDDRSFKGKREHWTYETQTGGKKQKKLVIFENSKVIELLNVQGQTKAHHHASQNTVNQDGAYCEGSNSFGHFPKGGGCNLYGCWPPGGYCNGFGCSSNGRCGAEGCPNKIPSYQCKQK